MSAMTGGRYVPGQDAARRAADYHDDRNGWLLFAGTMLVMISILNIIYGIAAIGSANFYVADAQYVISDLNTWGWAMVVIGVIQFSAASALLLGATWGRWIGIVSAGVNAIVQLLAIPGSPWLSLALFALDVLILYGLIVHGGRPRTA
jgi:hypothetical protein